MGLRRRLQAVRGRPVAEGRAQAAMTPPPTDERVDRALTSLRRVWGDRVIGPVARVVLTIVGLPVSITLLTGENPPIGVYLNGAIVGSLYGLVAVGLILVYRANRIINFAQASIGASPAVAGILLVVQRDVPYFLVI